ncbi:response regulator [Deferribacteres bacterium DY0037]
MVNSFVDNTPARILVVEDDRLTRKMLESIFNSIGLEMILAENGEQGLELFRLHRPEIVLSDYNMPGMSGLEMFSVMRTEAPQTKLVLMTIYTDSDVLIKAINMGVDRFLEKPVYKDKLQHLLNLFLEDLRIAKELTRYQNLLKAYRYGVDSSTIFSLLDSEGCFTYVNSNFCIASQYSEKELLGEHYSIVRKTDDIYDIKSVDNRDNGDENVWHGYITSISKSGYEYLTEVNLLPIVENGKLAGYISIEKDMSLVVSRYTEQLQAFFDADSSVMFAYDSSMKLKLSNQAFLDYFRFDTTEAAAESGFNLRDYIVDIEGERSEEIPIGEQNIKELFRSDGTVSSSRVVIRKPSDEKESYFIVNVFELDQSYLGLDKLTVVRLNDITELEDLKQKELTGAMLASIGKLAAGVTHEINTPLTYIKGNIELLEWSLEDADRDSSQGELQEYFHSIKDGISRITLIIESMREVTGDAKFEFEHANLYETFVMAGRMVYNRSKHIAPIYINRKMLTMELKPDEEYMPAYIVPVMLGQVWIILLNNSLDQLAHRDLTFDEKSIMIDIEPNIKGYRITIKDNGGGIAPEMLNKLFELFSSSKKHKGMGIGLNIAKSIVEKHNGTIRAYNINNGAAFEINI